MSEKPAYLFLGIPIFFWEGWDENDEDSLMFYGVEFSFPSMEEYNGMTASVSREGELEIYREWTDAELASEEEVDAVVWKGFVTKIPEVAAQVLALLSK